MHVLKMDLINTNVMWLEDKSIQEDYNCYKKFQINDLVAEVGDFVLVMNASTKADDADSCEVARILSAYENKANKRDPYRAKVQWYSKPKDLPEWCYNFVGSIEFYDREIIEDHRPFDNDVSIETFYQKCHVKLSNTEDIDDMPQNTLINHYICRYRLMPISKKKVLFDPVLEEERLLKSSPDRRILNQSTNSKRLNNTPKRLSNTPGLLTNTLLTPRRLSIQLEKLSIAEKENWSISENTGTKMLLKNNTRNRKSSIINNNSTKKISKINNDNSDAIKVDSRLSMKLEENSGDELPTLIISEKLEHDSDDEFKSLSKQNHAKKSCRKKLENNVRKSADSKSFVNDYSDESDSYNYTPRKKTNSTKLDRKNKSIPKFETPKNTSTPSMTKSKAINKKTSDNDVNQEQNYRISEIKNNNVIDDDKEQVRRSSRPRSKCTSFVDFYVNDEFLSPSSRRKSKNLLTNHKNSTYSESEDLDAKLRSKIKSSELSIISDKDILNRSKRSRLSTNTKEISKCENSLQTKFKSLNLLSPDTKNMTKSNGKMSTSNVKLTNTPVKKSKQIEDSPSNAFPKYSKCRKSVSVNARDTPKRKCVADKEVPDIFSDSIETEDDIDDDDFEVDESTISSDPSNSEENDASSDETSSHRSSSIPKRESINIRPSKRNLNEDLQTDTTPKKRTKSMKAISNSRSHIKRLSLSSDDLSDDFVSKTPKSRSLVGSFKKKINLCQLRPSLPLRVDPIKKTDKSSKSPEALPCRENEIKSILLFLKNCIIEHDSRFMYIAGLPGTGKTACVNHALSLLKKDKKVPEFDLIEVNGMKLLDPKHCFVQIHKQMTGKTVSWSKADEALKKLFSDRTRKKQTVLFIDELDQLYTRKQDVIYSILEWTTNKTSRLTVIGIANMINLPENLLKKVGSRFGTDKIVFNTYNHTQLQNIIRAKFRTDDITPDALQLIARKVAAVTGDARRAVSLTARAVQMARGCRVTTQHVSAALAENTANATVSLIVGAAPAQRLVLRAMAAEVEHTGLEEHALSKILSICSALYHIDGPPFRSERPIPPPDMARLVSVCKELSGMGLLILKPCYSDCKVQMTCSPDDVHFAVRKAA